MTIQPETRPDLRDRGFLVSIGWGTIIMGAWLTNHVATIFLVDWTLRAWPLAFALIALQTWLSVGLFIVAHDTMHGSFAPGQRALNRLVGQICVGLYAGFSYAKLHEKHHAHHRFAGTPDDPDFDVKHGSQFWPWYFKFFRTYFGMREFALLSTAVLIYALVLRERTPLLLAFWALPAFLSSIQLFYFGTFLPHHVDDQPFSDQHRTRSNDFPWIVSLLTCFHFGYHHTHHDKPWVPWWRLPKARSLSQTKTG
jgi:beta-carotene/zeaxanthin 4-ketolase